MSGQTLTVLSETLRELRGAIELLRVGALAQAELLTKAKAMADAALTLCDPEPLPALRRRDRGVPSSLATAIVRSGHTRDEVSFLAGIPRARLQALCAGLDPDEDERERLRAAVVEWIGG